MSGDTFLNGRYRLIAQQGSGGMAVIYKAIDQALGRTVAVKILRPSLTADPSFIVRFQNEARSIANLSHPNIVTVYDVGSDGATNYIVMEFIDGQDLKKIIRAHGALPADRALNLSIGICAGLGFAHRAGIVHADVKPQNVLVTKDDVVKITDFGIAQALSDTQPAQRQSVVWGSPHYFAPEQAQGDKPTAPSDVYSIGIVMFEILTGRLPYTGANQQELALAHIRDRIPLVTEINPNVSESLSKLVARAMSKNPSDRFRTADQLGQLLIAYRDRGRGYTVQGAPVGADQSIPTPPPQGMPNQPSQQGFVSAPQVDQNPQMPPVYPHKYPTGQPAEALPTQRYNAAPDAPNPIGFDRGAVPAPTDPRGYGAGQSQHGVAGTTPRPPQMTGDSRPLTPRYPYNHEVRQQESNFTLDGVTLALAMLAFMAVACLIPLYIAVLQAHAG